MKIITIKDETLEQFASYICPLLEKCGTIIEKLKKEAPSLDPQKDARILYYLFLREDIQSYLLSFAVSNQISDKDWWENGPFKRSLENSAKSPEEFIKDRAFHYNLWVDGVFFLSFYSGTENYLRLIAEVYDNGSCNSYKVWKIVRNLIDKLGLDENYKKLWKVVSNVRNSVHSGGIHTDKTDQIIFKEKSFEFTQGSPISFLHSENVSFLILQCLEILFQITIHSEILSIQEVRHNHADVEFLKDEN